MSEESRSFLGVEIMTNQDTSMEHPENMEREPSFEAMQSPANGEPRSGGSRSLTALSSDDGHDDNNGKRKRSWCRKVAWWSSSFLLDYLGIALFFGLTGILYLVIDLHARRIFIDDRSISKQLKDDTIPNDVLTLILVLPSFAAPLLFYFKRKRDMFEDLHAYVLAGLAALAIVNVTQGILKNTSGVARPDFIARCAPACLENIRWAYVERDDPIGGYGEWPTECSGDPRYDGTVECSDADTPAFTGDGPCAHLIGIPLTNITAECQYLWADGGVYSTYGIEDGYRSFPSGHTAHGACMAMILWLYVMAKTNSYRVGAPDRSFYPGLFWASAYSFMVIYVSVTRFTDNKHHVFDIIFGAALGVLSALPAFFLYYPDIRVSSLPFRRRRRGFMEPFCCRYVDADKLEYTPSEQRQANEEELELLKTGSAEDLRRREEKFGNVPSMV